MPSMRPSHYAMQQRSDDGPFLLFLREDLSEQYEVEARSEPQSDSGFDLETEAEVHGMSLVFYSDVPLPDDSPDWHLILEVTPDDLTIYPIYARSGHEKYAKPKYDSIRSIKITRPVYQPYAHPANKEDVDDLLSALPEGFAKDWRYGLGFLYEYRYIAQALASIKGVETIMLHGQEGRNDTLIEGDTYLLGVEQFQQLKKQLDRLTQRHQRETAEDKKLVCYAGLLHKASPENYPAKARRLSPDFLANLVALGSGPTPLSLKDQKQAAALAQQNVPALAKTARRTLYSLKSEIELVTLGQLIEVYRSMLDGNATRTNGSASSARIRSSSIWRSGIP